MTTSPLSLPFSRRQALIMAVAVLAMAPVATMAVAHDYEMGEIHIDHPWARATAPTATTGAAFMEFTNRGSSDDRLTGAEGGIAERIELHATEVDAEGVMRMREIEGGIDLPAGATVTLESGQDHIMLIGLEAGLREGDTFPLTLIFEQAGSITVDVHVEPISGPGEHHDHNHDHGH